MNERLTKLYQSRHPENILEQMVPQELDKSDKVLSIEFYAEFTKRNVDDNKLEFLECHWTGI